MKKIKAILILLFISFAILSQRNVYAVPYDANIWIDPSSQTVNVGGSVSINIDVEILSMDLYGAGITLSYDKSILNFLGAVEGSFLLNNGGYAGVCTLSPDPCTEFWELPFDMVPPTGGIDVVNILIGAVSGATGSGTLATLNFEAIGAGTSPLLIEYAKLVSSDCPIVDGIPDCVVLTTQLPGPATVNAVPEPATLLLVGSGILASLGVRRFKKKV